MTSKSKAQDKHKMSEIDDHILRYFDIKKRLGKGAYGIVWKALEKRTNQTVAVKKIFDAFRDETDAQRTYREIMFLRAFRNHPNIVQLHNIHRANNNLDIYLSFEYMESDLHNIIKKGTILKDIHKRYVIYQLVNAIKYIHSGNVIHRDLKPSNVLIDSKCRCKLADFGLARSVSNRPVRDTNDIKSDLVIEPMLTDYVATRWYRAPEILVASKRYTKGIDMWSLGCILAEMIRGKPIFQGSSTVNQIEKIVAALPEISEQDIAAVGAGFGSVLLNKQILAKSSATLDDLLIDAPDDAKILVKSLLVLDPLGRLTAKETLCHKYIEKFRHSMPEIELKSDVLPPFRDDVRLSITEYRSKLYEIVQTNDRHFSHSSGNITLGNSSANRCNGKQTKKRETIRPIAYRKSEYNIINNNYINKKLSSPTNETQFNKDKYSIQERKLFPQKDFSANQNNNKQILPTTKISTNSKKLSPLPKDTNFKTKSSIFEQQQRIETKQVSQASKITNYSNLGGRTFPVQETKSQTVNTNSYNSHDQQTRILNTIAPEKDHPTGCTFGGHGPNQQQCKKTMSTSAMPSNLNRDKRATNVYNCTVDLKKDIFNNNNSNNIDNRMSSSKENSHLSKNAQVVRANSQYRQTRSEIISTANCDGSNCYYEQRLKKLEQDIEKHKNAIKAFCQENPIYADCQKVASPRIINDCRNKMSQNRMRPKFIGGSNIPIANNNFYDKYNRINENSSRHISSSDIQQHNIGGSGDHINRRNPEVIDTIVHQSKQDSEFKSSTKYI